MMRLHFAFSVLLATAVVLPNAARGKQDDVALKGTLSRTVRAIESLNNLREQLEAGEFGAIERLLVQTEAPIMQDRQRDEFLVTLRKEVSGLQMSVDALLTDPSLKVQPTARRSTNAQTAGGLTSGLSPEMRRAIGAQPNMVDTRSGPTGELHTNKREIEAPGFVADRLRQGRLYFRTGRYEDALGVLKTIKNSVQARYWEARSLERLDRTSAALELYRELSEQTEDASIAARAKSDLNFLTWKNDFQQRARKTDK